MGAVSTTVTRPLKLVVGVDTIPEQRKEFERLSAPLRREMHKWFGRWVQKLVSFGEWGSDGRLRSARLKRDL
jgi:hypothetical protein